MSPLSAAFLSLGLKIILAGGLLFGIAIFLRPDELWAALQGVDQQTLGFVSLLGGVGIGVQWAKWHYLLARYRPGTTWNEALKSLWVGFGLGLISPGRLGELGRGAFFVGENRLALAFLSGIDRLSSSAVTLIAGWIALWTVYPWAGSWTSLALAAGMGVASLWRRGSKHKLHLTPFNLLSRREWPQVLAWSALFNLVFFVQFYLLVRGGGGTALRLAQAIPLLFALKTLFPLSFLDLGVREGAAVLVFARLGLDPAPAFNAALLLFIINILVPGIGGLVVACRQGMPLFSSFKRAASLSV